MNPLDFFSIKKGCYENPIGIVINDDRRRPAYLAIAARGTLPEDLGWVIAKIRNDENGDYAGWFISDMNVRLVDYATDIYEEFVFP